jgi:hypothetical protein
MAPNDAQFSALSKVHVHCSLSSQMLVNGVRSDVIATTAPAVQVGRQQHYEPLHLLKIPADQLTGQKISRVTMSITDQNNNPLNTNGESWSMEGQIEYLVKADQQ